MKNKIEKYFIDDTPDGNYALRILQAYRMECELLWTANSDWLDVDDPLIKELNKLQEDRREELEIAIQCIKENKQLKEEVANLRKDLEKTLPLAIAHGMFDVTYVVHEHGKTK